MSKTVITNLPLAPADERRKRVIKYSVMMAIRFICIIACFFVHGGWLLVSAFGAIALPYIAVLVANTVLPTKGAQLTRPGPVVLLNQQSHNEQPGSEPPNSEQPNDR